MLVFLPSQSPVPSCSSGTTLLLRSRTRLCVGNSNPLILSVPAGLDATMCMTRFGRTFGCTKMLLKPTLSRSVLYHPLIMPGYQLQLWCSIERWERAPGDAF